MIKYRFLIILICLFIYPDVIIGQDYGLMPGNSSRMNISELRKSENFDINIRIHPDNYNDLKLEARSIQFFKASWNLDISEELMIRAARNLRFKYQSEYEALAAIGAVVGGLAGVIYCLIKGYDTQQVLKNGVISGAVGAMVAVVPVIIYDIL